MKILLVGHACGPDRGSESGVVWNWAWHLSFKHRVWVITHPQFREDVEHFLAHNPNPNLNFVWFTLPPRWDPWRSAQGEKGLRLHYLLWQRTVFREALRLHNIYHFDLAHQMSLSSIAAPPLLWRLPIPFIWGPLGGGQTAPPAFRRYFGQSWRYEMLRTLWIRVLPRLPALREAVRRSALVLSANPETARVLASAGAKRVRHFFDIGLPRDFMPIDLVKREDTRAELTILWAGRLIPCKALSLALEALVKVGSTLPVRLLVVGDGPLRGEMEKLACALGVGDRVQFFGAVPWRQMPQFYQRADVFLFTSLRDSVGSVSLEAMAHGLPILTLDHNGVGALVPHDAGIKVPVSNPAETVLALAQGIRHLAQSPETRRRMGEAAWKYAQTHVWDGRIKQMSQWYEEVVDKQQRLRM